MKEDQEYKKSVEYFMREMTQEEFDKWIKGKIKPPYKFNKIKKEPKEGKEYPHCGGKL